MRLAILASQIGADRGKLEDNDDGIRDKAQNDTDPAPLFRLSRRVLCAPHIAAGEL